MKLPTCVDDRDTPARGLGSVHALDGVLTGAIVTDPFVGSTSRLPFGYRDV